MRPCAPLAALQVCHKWWDVLLKSVRAIDLAAADAAGDTSLRACLAKLPLSDDELTPQIAMCVARHSTALHCTAQSMDLLCDGHLQLSCKPRAAVGWV